MADLKWNSLYGVITLVAVMPVALIQIYFGNRQFLLTQHLSALGRENYYYVLLMTTAASLREIISFGSGRYFIGRHRDVFRQVFNQTQNLRIRSTTWNVVASLFANGIIMVDQFAIVVTAVAQRMTVGYITMP